MHHRRQSVHELDPSQHTAMFTAKPAMRNTLDGSRQRRAWQASASASEHAGAECPLSTEVIAVAAIACAWAVLLADAVAGVTRRDFR